MNTADCVVVATVGRPFGVRGWVHVNSHTDPPHNLINFKEWYIELTPGGRELVAVSPRTQEHAKRLVATWDPLVTRDDATGVTGRLIYIPTAELPRTEGDEYYWHDLIGLEVVNRQGLQLGIVERLVSTGPHDVLVIRGGKTHYVPFVANYVDEVIPNKAICVDWLEAWSE